MMLFFSFLQVSEVYSLKSILLVEQWQIRRRNLQARSILRSCENQVEATFSSCQHIYTHLSILIAGEVEEKEELKNLLMWHKSSFHVTVDRELLTYMKNKK